MGPICTLFCSLNTWTAVGVTLRALGQLPELLPDLALLRLQGARQELALSRPDRNDLVAFVALGSVEWHEVQAAEGVDLPLGGGVVLGRESGLLTVTLTLPGSASAGLGAFGPGIPRGPNGVVA